MLGSEGWVWQGLGLPRLPRHPFHGGPKWVSCRLTISAARTNVVFLIRRTVRPSGIPVAVVWRPRCGGQYRLSFFGRRVGPCRSGEVALVPATPMAQ